MNAGLLGVRSRLPRPALERLIEGREELGERHVKRPGQPIDDIHRRGLLPPLQVADVGPVQPGSVGQVFLRETVAAPELSDSSAQGGPHVLHARIVTTGPLSQP